MFLKGYDRSKFRNFETDLKIVVGLGEDGNQLISKPENSIFVTNGLPPGIYSIKDISELV